MYSWSAGYIVTGLEEFRRLVTERLEGRVLLVTVFGSRAKGRWGLVSDVDVAVLPASEEVDERLLLACEVAELASLAFGVPDDRVDVVFLDEELPIGLLYEAVARGVLTYCADEDLYARLRLRVISEYLDFRLFREKLELEHKFVKALGRGLVNG
ncbi:MAG: hypothetical protein DRJ57_02620 [Thermoprotei archaeon]|nr:MAG: hypothetical protein DRJ57_02620 [Thermoprotei archaeon]